MQTQKLGKAEWTGGLKDGKGAITTETKALESYPYGFAARFEDKPGTNPEELIGAAHAACFTMAMSMALGEAGYTAESMETTAKVTLVQEGKDINITQSHLNLRASIPGIDNNTFMDIANTVKSACPVSKVLNAEISLEVHLSER